MDAFTITGTRGTVKLMFDDGSTHFYMNHFSTTLPTTYSLACKLGYFDDGNIAEYLGRFEDKRIENTFDIVPDFPSSKRLHN